MSLSIFTLDYSCPRNVVSETFSQMMGKSESGLVEPHEQEHLAILALAGCALGAKRFPPSLETRYPTSEKAGQTCASKSDENHVRI